MTDRMIPWGEPISYGLGSENVAFGKFCLRENVL